MRVLLDEGTLNPAPEKVLDPKFREKEFFDPCDGVQVKYEMLRHVSVENASVTDAAHEYGVSRPTYYQAKERMDKAGIAIITNARTKQSIPASTSSDQTQGLIEDGSGCRKPG